MGRYDLPENPLLRYAAPEVAEIWGPRWTIQAEHQTWIAVLVADTAAGLPGCTTEVLSAYEKVAQQYRDDPAYRGTYHQLLVDAEYRTRHQTKARIEVFDTLAGDHGRIHLGMTSSDITETVQQQQLWRSAGEIHDHLDSLQVMLANDAHHWRDTVIAGRTHNRPAQPTTLGHRYARCNAELRRAAVAISDARGGYHWRGIRGAVGTNADRHSLHPNGDPYRYPMHEIPATGQSYPRGVDLPVCAGFLAAAAACASFATTVRLAAGHGHVREVRADGQVGSSAMPHKTNPILAERICALQKVIRGYHLMLAETCGDGWNEGDISDSATRRVALPGICLATSGLLIAFEKMICRLDWDTSSLWDELRARRMELNSGAALTVLVRAGTPREAAHQAIRALYDGDGGEAVRSLPDGAAAVDRLYKIPDLADVGDAVLEVDALTRAVEAGL